mmetsp:Transcript_3211/g.11473  ORF Transcript_3211/g.11473 Transcript_3211/m.11473 type:complete len:236 (-) Transcript_3211:2537-3244(-)
MSISKNSTRMRLERHFDLNEKVKRIAFVQIFCSFNATRLNSVIAAGDIMQSYIEEVGKLAIGNAEYGVSIFIETEFVSHKVEQGRSQINILDVLQGLQALGDDLKSIILYADTLDSKPFAIPLPKKFVIRRRPKVQTSFLKVAEPQPTNIPHYFPAFPDKHTYSNSYGLRSAKKIEKKHTDRRKESKIMLKAESGSFNGNVMNKVGENFRKIKRKQEIEKFDTFMDRYNVNFCGK